MNNQNTAVKENDAEVAQVEQETIDTSNENVDANGDTDIEDKARRMGWIPKEDYRGPEENWTDAETFYNKGLEELPIMRERYKTLERNFDKFEKESKQAIKDMKDHTSRVEKQAYKNAMKDLIKEQEEAVEDGDKQRYREIEKEKEDLQAKHYEAEVPQDNQMQMDPIEQREIQAWMDRESWYNKDHELAASANAYHASISQSQPGLSLRESLDAVSKQMRVLFPEKFGINPKRQMPPTVESANKVSRKKPNAKSYENLPPEAKKVCDRQVSRGDITKEEFLKYYEWE